MRATNSVYSILDSGRDGTIATVECHVSNGLPSILIVGFANKAVDEAKERLRGAFASSKLTLPRQRITINLAPADIPKDSTCFDLAMAAAILKASGQCTNLPTKCAVLGELGLEGTIRPIRGIIGRLIAAKSQGIDTFVVPAANMEQASLVPGVKLIGVPTLQEFYRITNDSYIANAVVDTNLLRPQQIPPGDTAAEFSATLDDIVGQEIAKRAIMISAAGGHNILLGGPPGTGKSMLAQVLPHLLPPMTRTEILEVTHLHSLANNNFDQLVTLRPFRAPHHSASTVAIVGGGNTIRPGEMSLAHGGVLLFDEFPEFARTTIEALRQPLETRVVSIARAKETADFPAHFIFVATANPCPCGYHGTSKPCRCMPHQIAQYRRKLSGPILDRIDLYVNVHAVEHRKLLETAQKPRTEGMDHARAAVSLARRRQSERYHDVPKLNADMNNRELKSYAYFTDASKQMLDQAAEKFGLSGRAYMRCVKVARTIADLDDSDRIETKHVAEALQYRPHQFHDGM